MQIWKFHSWAEMSLNQPGHSLQVSGHPFMSPEEVDGSWGIAYFFLLREWDLFFAKRVGSLHQDSSAKKQ